MIVIKVSGHELDDPQFLGGLCDAIAGLGRRALLVHGGGKEITAALERYGQASTFIDGLRVTPPEAMAVMEMVVCGSINKRIVAALVSRGVRALGLSGVDLGLVRAVPLRPELGRVGSITAVDADALAALLERDWLPVLAPVALGEGDNMPYNLNADHAAQAVAAALAAEELVFVSNVPGVILGGALAPELRRAEIEAAIASGDISGGMIPKVQSALAALDAGVAAVRITNLAGARDGGTRII
jgi:acetylglutamate kinase